MKLKIHIGLWCLLCFAFAKAQTAMHNYGNLRIHPTGQIGFHTDLINDGTSLDNNGLAGFYNTNTSLSFSGVNQINFENIELQVDDDLELENSIGITGSLDFISGRFITPRSDTSIRLKFLNDNFYQGDNDMRHVDGFNEFTGNRVFRFPIGDEFEMKSLSIDNFAAGQTFNAAFFREDPNTPSTFAASFNTSNFEPTIEMVSTSEFWYFQGSGDIDITLHWTASSDVSNLVTNLSDLRIVGWDPFANIWVDLGNDTITGDTTTGTITARVIDAQQYNIYTLSGIDENANDVIVYNGLSPDGDGRNDTLVIRGIEDMPDNELIIFNRWGVQVYQMVNYDNSFSGISQGRVTIEKNKELPEGTYYYVLRMPDRENVAGYFYINR